MRSLLLVLLLGFAVASPAAAQAEQGYEFFAGLNYAQLDVGDPAGEPDAVGWQGSITEYLSSWFGLGADFAGHYGDAASPPGVTDVHVELYSFLFGPRVRVLNTDAFTVSGHALFGAASGNAEQFDEIDFAATKFAYALGGAVDWNVTDRLAWRVIQPEVLTTTFGGATQRTFRVATGLAYRFSGI